MISPLSSHLSLCHPQLYHHLRTQSKLIPLYLSMQWSRANTEYSIHRLQAYAEYSMHRAWYTPRTEPSEARLSTAPCQSLIFWQTMWYSILYILTITICPMKRVLAPVTLPGQTTASTLTTSQCSMNFARRWPPMCISIFAWSQSWRSHSHSLQVHIAKLTRSLAPSASPNSLQNGLHV
jgi:hypothetical protein